MRSLALISLLAVLFTQCSYANDTDKGRIEGINRHRGLVAKRSPIHLVRLTENVQKDFAKLVYRFKSLNMRYEADIQPVVLKTPTMRLRFSNSKRSNNVIAKSDHDIAKSWASYEKQALSDLSSFLKKHSVSVIKATSKGLFIWNAVPAGNYMICCNGQIKNPDKRPMFLPALWWREIDIEGGNTATLKFTIDDVREWNNLFSDYSIQAR